MKIELNKHSASEIRYASSKKSPSIICILGAAMVGAVCILPAAGHAYLWRGYPAVGGEILLPVLAVVLVNLGYVIIKVKNRYIEYLKKKINKREVGNGL